MTARAGLLGRGCCPRSCRVGWVVNVLLITSAPFAALRPAITPPPIRARRQPERAARPSARPAACGASEGHEGPGDRRLVGHDGPSLGEPGAGSAHTFEKGSYVVGLGSAKVGEDPQGSSSPFINRRKRPSWILSPRIDS